MTKQAILESFNPNVSRPDNGNFGGLPFTEEHAEVVLLPVPWSVTIDQPNSTATGPDNILKQSTHINLFDEGVEEAWKMGIYTRGIDKSWQSLNREYKKQAEAYYKFLEAGGCIADAPQMQELLQEINKKCEDLNAWVKAESGKLLDAGKIVGVVGGDHSVPLGLMQALAERYPNFGVLQIDAHMDLQKEYEGFKYSHFSLMYNALKLPQLSVLSQVAVRGFSKEEHERAMRDTRVKVFTDANIDEALFRGHNYHELTHFFMQSLPEHVYISFDIDGLEPSLCPNASEPVPGGLSFNKVVFLLKHLQESGRKIIGFDLCETAGLPHKLDGSVAAKVLYKMANIAGKSQGRI